MASDNTQPNTDKPQPKAPTEIYFFPEYGRSVEAASLEEAQKLVEQKK